MLRLFGACEPGRLPLRPPRWWSRPAAGTTTPSGHREIARADRRSETRTDDKMRAARAAKSSASAVPMSSCGISFELRHTLPQADETASRLSDFSEPLGGQVEIRFG